VKKKKTNRHSPKRRSKKKSYCIRNWREYNRSLVQRGSLTIWCDQAALTEWVQPQRSGRRGASNTYSNNAIVVALVLKEVYHQTLRGTQGLLQSVLKLLNATDLPVPDYSTLCRRGKDLIVPLGKAVGQGPVHLVIDSTGCKVFGEGEWKVRQHGYNKHRTWRKVHLGIDEATGQIEAAILSTNGTSDGEMFPELMSQVRRPVRQVSADGAYDTRPCYDVVDQRAEQQGTGITVAIPPRKRARLEKHGNTRGKPLTRDQNIRRIREVGRKRWKEETGYHRRSLAETTMFRMKTIFGDELGARCIENQGTEVFVRCQILNRMNLMGRPDSYRLETT
jgi:hypothetical protein